MAYWQSILNTDPVTHDTDLTSSATANIRPTATIATTQAIANKHLIDVLPKNIDCFIMSPHKQLQGLRR